MGIGASKTPRRLSFHPGWRSHTGTSQSLIYRPPVSSSLPEEGWNILGSPGVLPQTSESESSFLRNSLNQPSNSLGWGLHLLTFPWCSQEDNWLQEIVSLKEISMNGSPCKATDSTSHPENSRSKPSAETLPLYYSPSWNRSAPGAWYHQVVKFNSAWLLTSTRLWTLSKQTWPQNTAFAKDFSDHLFHPENLVPDRVTPYPIPCPS